MEGWRAVTVNRFWLTIPFAMANKMRSCEAEMNLSVVSLFSEITQLKSRMVGRGSGSDDYGSGGGRLR